MNTKKVDYNKYFIVGNRVNGKEYTFLKRYPEDMIYIRLYDLIQQIHEDCFYRCFPNDWIYSEVASAFESIEQNMSTEQFAEPDVYHRQQLEWLLDNPYATYFCDEAMQRGLYKKDFMNIISIAQIHARALIFEKVLEFVENEEKNIS
jgi:hypothetical protein